MRHRPLHRLASLALVTLAGLVPLAAPAVLPGLAPVAVAQTAAETGSAKTVSKVTVDGKGVERTIGLTVGKTADLAGRERVDVSWTGAEPTPNLTAEENAREFPMALMQCRGVDTASTSIDRRSCLVDAGFRGNGDDWRYDVNVPPATDPASADVPYSTPAPAPVCNFSRRGVPGTFPDEGLPYVGVDGAVYRFCGDSTLNPGTAPADLVQSDPLPRQFYGAATAADGRGSARFEVRSREQHASLGCSATVPCSLVAVPVMQLPCNPDYDDFGLCAAGPTNAGGLTDRPANPRVTMSEWWQESNWRNRLTVPLQLLPTAAQCAAVDARPQLLVDGSELMAPAMRQWVPDFCLDQSSDFRLSYAPTGDELARSAVQTGRSLAALTTRPLGGSRPVVNGPVGVTGFAVSFVLEARSDGKVEPIRDLRLTPRLLAKVLTESYTGPAGSRYATVDDPGTPRPHPAIGNNPTGLYTDPEFLRLNPTLAALSDNDRPAVYYPTLISIDSDLTFELTRYITADPAAVAWLGGVPDEDGMIVNPAFADVLSNPDLAQRWPTGRFELRDTTPQVKDAGGNICAQEGVPYLNNVINPLQSLRESANSVLDAKPTQTTVCDEVESSPSYGKLKTRQLQPEGSRAVLAVTSVGDAALYGLDTAALQVGTDTAGAPVFVPPTQETLRTALGAMEVDPATNTFRLDHTKASATAYPGTMVVNLAVPTTGLEAAQAERYATLMEQLSGPLQTSGTGVGQLPAGYVPLPPEMVAVARTAAAEIRAQQGGVVPETTPPVVQAPASMGQSDPSGPFVPGAGLVNPVAPVSSGTSGGAAAVAPPVDAPVGADVAPAAAAPAPAAEPEAVAAPVAVTRGESSATGRWALPTLLGVGLAVGLLGPLAFAVAQPGNPVRRAGTWALTTVRGR